MNMLNLIELRLKEYRFYRKISINDARFFEIIIMKDEKNKAEEYKPDQI